MVEQFINELTIMQLTTIIFLVVYLLIYGVKYHILAIGCYIRGRTLTSNVVGVILNYLGYISIVCCAYWFI